MSETDYLLMDVTLFVIMSDNASILDVGLLWQIHLVFCGIYTGGYIAVSFAHLAVLVPFVVE